MTMVGTRTCAMKSARLNLIEETIQTGIAITIDRADSYAAPITFRPGDPRLAALKQLLDTLVLEPTTYERIELRTLLRIACQDGTESVVIGSRTEPDGLIHLALGDRIVSTRTPFRSVLDALAAQSS